MEQSRNKRSVLPMILRLYPPAVQIDVGEWADLSCPLWRTREAAGPTCVSFSAAIGCANLHILGVLELESLVDSGIIATYADLLIPTLAGSQPSPHPEPLAGPTLAPVASRRHKLFQNKEFQDV